MLTPNSAPLPVAAYQGGLVHDVTGPPPPQDTAGGACGEARPHPLSCPVTVGRGRERRRASSNVIEASSDWGTIDPSAARGRC